MCLTGIWGTATLCHYCVKYRLSPDHWVLFSIQLNLLWGLDLESSLEPLDDVRLLDVSEAFWSWETRNHCFQVQEGKPSECYIIDSWWQKNHQLPNSKNRLSRIPGSGRDPKPQEILREGPRYICFASLKWGRGRTKPWPTAISRSNTGTWEYKPIMIHPWLGIKMNIKMRVLTAPDKARAK